MCQAYEAERNWVIHMENSATIAGWNAHRMGKPRSANPMSDVGCERAAWDHGWNCRNGEAVIPWAIEKRFRIWRASVTGEPCYKTPTFNQADRIAKGEYRDE